MLDSRCMGCSRIVEGHPYKSYLSCGVYSNPEQYPWKITGTCNLASHLARTVETPVVKKRLGQQKQRKAK